ncbi:hypothetical protein [Flagellimonas sp.]|uniref:hypothetical protein n=1 Tax=Flagellimonas sp. TaxID=2058762 RepID=UPI003B5973AA
MLQRECILSLIICFSFLYVKGQLIKERDLEFIQNEWAISRLESDENKIVYRVKNHFFVNNNYYEASSTSTFSEKYIVRNAINRPRRICGNEYFSKNNKQSAKRNFTYKTKWELIDIGELQILKISNLKVNDFEEVVLLKEEFFELEELTKDKMVLTRL